MNPRKDHHEENELISDTSLRKSYQLQAARLLVQFPFLSSYFALQAVDSETCPSNISLQSGVINNVFSTKNNEAVEDVSNETTAKKKVIECKYEELENDLLCSTCGLHLSAGHFNTTIRLRRLNRGSTRRRRSSRYYDRYPDFLHLKQGAITPNTKMISPKQRRHATNNSKDQNEHQRSIQQKIYCQTMKRITDGQAKSCVVYKCGICHERMKLKSISVVASLKQKEQYLKEQNNKKKTNELNQDQINNKRDHQSFFLQSQKKDIVPQTSIFSTFHKQQQYEERKKLGSSFIGFSFASNSTNNTSQNLMKKTPTKINFNIDSTIGMNDEFVPVGNSRSNQTSKRSKSLSNSIAKKTIAKFNDENNQIMSPLLHIKKKRRKRGKSEGGNSEKTKKSELMDFLASLND